jgi:hypothetical protein
LEERNMADDNCGYDLVIDGDKTDWSEFGERGLDTVIDPMVFRSADVFLRGKKEAEETLGQDGDDVWEALSANVGSLVAFFDTLLLSERLPIIDYGITFDNQLTYETQPLRDRVNAMAPEPLLQAVHVMGKASDAARDMALGTLKGQRPPDRKTRDSILNELRAFGHEWRPDVGALQAPSPNDERLLQFAYGGRLFAEYAAQAKVAHLLQPNRADLYLKLGLEDGTSDEDALFARLRERLGDDAAILDLNGLPAFLPYLLSCRPRNPEELLQEALNLRMRGEVTDYRGWRRALLREWRDRKRIDRRVERDLKSAARALAKEFNPVDMPKVELKLTVAGLVGEVTVPLQRLLGWAATKVPGRRHTTLLMRMAAARDEYDTLDTDLNRVWTGR